MRNNKYDSVIPLGIIIISLITMFLLWDNMSTVRNEFDDNVVKLKYERENTQRLTETIHAYNALLHRIWIDNPSYVEDVLCETDEYVDFEPFISESDFDEIFSFHNQNDSNAYYMNLNNR